MGHLRFANKHNDVVNTGFRMDKRSAKYKISQRYSGTHVNSSFQIKSKTTIDNLSMISTSFDVVRTALIAYSMAELVIFHAFGKGS
uniref:Transposase n=1 Tax=Schistosoma mansoni TaxID=6183 RepID=A0A5K4F8Z7_SCHMA